MLPSCGIYTNKFNVSFSSTIAPHMLSFSVCPSCQAPAKFLNSSNAVVCEFIPGDFTLVRRTECSKCDYALEEVYDSVHQPSFWKSLTSKQSACDLTGSELAMVSNEVDKLIAGLLKQYGLGTYVEHVYKGCEYEGEDEEYEDDDEIEIIGCSGITEDDTLNQNNNVKRRFEEFESEDSSLQIFKRVKRVKKVKN